MKNDEEIIEEIKKVKKFFEDLEIENYRINTYHTYINIIKFEVNMFGYHNFRIITDNFLYFKKALIKKLKFYSGYGISSDLFNQILEDIERNDNRVKLHKKLSVRLEDKKTETKRVKI